ncbi:putative E3 Ubiquitin-Protein Ligase Rnf217 [Manis pentadactyla]|nr:putative E3 Ubiquitin-Protein Ligase Rnf217 [Manis pentadactyla]
MCIEKHKPRCQVLPCEGEGHFSGKGDVALRLWAAESLEHSHRNPNSCPLSGISIDRWVFRELQRLLSWSCYTGELRKLQRNTDSDHLDTLLKLHCAMKVSWGNLTQADSSLKANDLPGGEPQSTGAHISESGLYREDALNRGDFPTEELLILLKKKKGSSDKIFFSIENLKLVCIV